MVRRVRNLLQGLILWAGLGVPAAVADDVKLFIPEKIYAVPGVEMNVYFSNVVTVINPANYIFDVDCPKGSNGLKRWNYVPADNEVGSYPWRIRVIGSSGVVAEARSELVVVPRDAGKDKKIEVISKVFN